MNEYCKLNPELCEELPSKERRYILDSNSFDFQKKYRIDARIFPDSLKEALNLKKSNYVANLPPKATIKELSNERLEQAALVKASKLMYSEGLSSAQKHLDITTKGKWTIDASLSNLDSLVLVNRRGETKIAYRGTEIYNPEDIVSDAALFKFAERELPQYQRAQTQLRSTLLKYGKPQELVGFSLGGNRAMSLSNEFGIPARVFNPAVLGNLFFESNKLVSITRTTDDIISLGAAYTPFTKIEIINPLRDNINPIHSHTLDNFETNQTRATIKDYLKPIDVTGIATGLVAGALAEKTLSAIEKRYNLKMTTTGRSTASGFLGGVYSLPFAGAGLSTASILPVVSSGAIAGYTAAKVSRENIGTSNPVARSAVSGAAAAGVGYATLLLGDAYYGAEIGSLFGPAGLVVGTIVGGLLGAGAELISLKK